MDAIQRATTNSHEDYVLGQLERAKRWLAEAEKLIRESAGVKFSGEE